MATSSIYVLPQDGDVLSIALRERKPFWLVRDDLQETLKDVLDDGRELTPIEMLESVKTANVIPGGNWQSSKFVLCATSSERISPTKRGQKEMT